METPYVQPPMNPSLQGLGSPRLKKSETAFSKATQPLDCVEVVPPSTSGATQVRANPNEPDEQILQQGQTTLVTTDLGVSNAQNLSPQHIDEAILEQGKICWSSCKFSGMPTLSPWPDLCFPPHSTKSRLLLILRKCYPISKLRPIRVLGED
jgi:hypothetical protein